MGDVLWTMRLQNNADTRRESVTQIASKARSGVRHVVDYESL